MKYNLLEDKESDMETQILWQSDSGLEIGNSSKDEKAFLQSNMVEFARTIARPSTSFVVQFPTETVGRHFTPYMRYNRALLAVEILEKVKRAEEDGFDAAFPGMCYGEFFLQEARQAVSIPVVGAAESSMMLAQLLGGRFAVVTVADYFIPVIEETIRLHGWERRTIGERPVRAWTPDINSLMLDAYSGKPERLIEEFEQQALECVRDGADVVICGCNPYGAALSKVGYTEVGNTGVPVVSPLPAMIKLAEALVDLKRSLGVTKSEAVRSRYRSTPPEVLQDLAIRGIGMSQVCQPPQSVTAASKSREMALG